jgi:hypothetical protein
MDQAGRNERRSKGASGIGGCVRTSPGAVLLRRQQWDVQNSASDDDAGDGH